MSLLNPTPKSVLLLTDLEPDDVIAIKMLSTLYKNTDFTVIVGEGNVDKTSLMFNLLTKYQFTNFKI